MLSLASCGGQKSDSENDAENIQNEQTDSSEQEETAPEETTPEETAPEETEPGTDGEEQMPEEQPDEQPRSGRGDAPGAGGNHAQPDGFHPVFTGQYLPS